MNDKKQPTLEEILSGKSRAKKKPEWPKGDIREELKGRPETDWKELPVAVWVDLGKEVLEYALIGTLQKMRNLRKGDREYWINTGSEEKPRIVKCKGSRIRELEMLGDQSKSILKAMDQLKLKSEDKQSRSLEAKERQLIRAQIKRDRYLERLQGIPKHWLSEGDKEYWEQQLLCIPKPKGKKRKDPALNVAAIQEIMIAYLEGNNLARRKDSINSAFYIAGERVGLSDSRMEQHFGRWREEQARPE